ncbi:MAG TPA: DNA ligase D [Steroidobacteraceae bacterium]|nr:DNA ligase D [Steroidobacteraceae bacterium]
MKRSLDPYAAKRKFTRTPEPAPRLAEARRGPLLFVVQKHAARRLHYDFRLELDGVLKSWAVPKGPSLDPADKRLAVEVEDHPFDYASFEGVIPEKEYGAGNVIVWDCGVYSPDEGQEYSFGDRREAEERLRRELANGKLSFFLRGEKLKGSFALVRTSTPKQWLLIKHKDRFAQQNDVLARAQSVLSGRTVEDRPPAVPSPQIDVERLAPAGPQETMPKSMSPMLAEIGDAPRSDPRWSYEPKLDGYRVMAFVQDGKVRLQSRRGIDLTPAFPEITAALAAQAVDRMILDGELVALDGSGRPSFNALQNRATLKHPTEIAEAQRQASVVLLCFDLLHFAGLNLRGNSYVDRRRYLSQCLLPSAHVQLVHASDDAERLYAAALESGFEGIVSKRKDSTYQPGRRSQAWLKVKAVETSEFVVGGYTQGKGAREALGSLLLGYWRGDELHYVGHVGSGLDDEVLRNLRERLAGLARKQSPFAGKPPLHRPTRWLEPELVAEVNFAGWTPDGYLRAPVFLRLRDDVASHSIVSGPDGRAAGPAKEVSSANHVEDVLAQLENKANRIDLRVGEARIRVTNLDREYWPGNSRARQPAITKRDLLRYLVRVSPYMLPHLENRPLTMIRMPEGIDGERFFQKHWSQARPEFVETITVYSGHKDEQHEYLLANNLPSLIWLGQVGTLEFHVWHSRAQVGPDAATQRTDYSSSLEALESSVLNYPDYLVFDIDPYIYSGKETKGAEPELNKKGFATGRRVAFWLRDLLKEMSLEAVVKTSGKTGLHVFVPIERTVTFDQARALCEMVGRHLMREHPREITMEWAIEKRTGKIFYDYNMNVRGKTLNVAYSPRGVAGAPVSMPLTWEELEAAEPTDFTLSNAPARLDRTGDRWHDVFSTKQSLARAFASNRRKES